MYRDNARAEGKHREREREMIKGGSVKRRKEG
jgi:hypothetical protein